MTRFRGTRDAFGAPGIEPKWTRGDKDGLGTAYHAASRVWFTMQRGIVTECYYPTIDRPQTRDLQLLVTDGATFFHEERRHLQPHVTRFHDHALGYAVRSAPHDRAYSLHKEVLTDPHRPCVLQRVRLEGPDDVLDAFRLYALCAPHLEVGGWGNNAHVVQVQGRDVLVAERRGTWLALGADRPFTRASVGYVGASDGWTDIAGNMSMDWEFDRALDGNVALTGELALAGHRAFTLGLAFGQGLHVALTALFQSLAVPFEQHKARYEEQWARACRNLLPLGKSAGDRGNLYHGSYSLLMAHEDKTFPGALIASLSIPWGEAKGDEDMGGYHLVWTRDMCHSAMGLLAAGNTETPRNALIYLAASQQADGGFPQNFWLDGTPYWNGVQLDEVAFPILLAWRLREAGALGGFDPWPMVLRAAGYLIRHGPATQQERWEEASGYSPSTLASNIAALLCAGAMARERGEDATAQYLEEYADFLECHVEAWTVTTQGTLLPGTSRHYIRIHPVDIQDPHADEDPNRGTLRIANRGPGQRAEFPAKDVVDAGFLELVRYGIRAPEDPLVVDSLRVVDAVLKVDTPEGPCWKRYNHDGYGQRDDGGPYEGAGRGRAWPLLTGERAHYELAAGTDPGPFVQALERFATATGLLSEQVWDAPDLPGAHLALGKPTGAAMPLMWAHAEYIQLLRSASDGVVFARIPHVAQRYQGARRACKAMEIWKFNRQPRAVRAGHTLRVQGAAPFLLHWSIDGWGTAEDTKAAPTALDIHYADIRVPSGQREPIRFTFRWIATGRWEGRDFEVAVARNGSTMR